MEQRPQKSTRRIRAARTRQAILDAGLELLSADGLETLSLRGIARKIDYSAAALYEYFNNKEELLAAMTEIIGEELIRVMLAAVKSTADAKLQLIEVGLAVINYALDHPNYYALFSSMPFSPTKENRGDQCDGDSFELLTQFIEEALNKGVIKNPNHLPPEELGIILWGTVHGLASLQNNTLKDAPLNRERINREALRIVIEGLS